MSAQGTGCCDFKTLIKIRLRGHKLLLRTHCTKYGWNPWILTAFGHAKLSVINQVSVVSPEMLWRTISIVWLLL